MFKRIFLFVVTNIAIITTITFTVYLIKIFTGIDIFAMTNNGSYTSLFIYALIIGFTGSFISLFLSKFIAKFVYKVQLIDENSIEYRWIYDYIDDLSKKVGIERPEIGIFSGSPNAFATGWSKNSSLIAISDGLLESMNKDEVKGVIAHEMTHITSGDMVTMTLLQGIINTFVIFFARIIGEIVDKAIFKSENRGIGYIGTVIFFEIFLSILASMIIMAFSRYREYKADEGAVKLSGKEGIYNALAKLGQLNPPPLKENLKTFGIVGFTGLFRSHPPIEKRLEHIKNL